MVAIEISMALPFALFMLGEDGIAIEFCYFALMLCIVSQIPKRFIWRWRPWMVGRARKVRESCGSKEMSMGQIDQSQPS